jgi:threonylcarbamoyladenosine tRNA methylthiotransferase MtaB
MIANKKVAFYTLRCELNFSKRSTIARDFVNEDFECIDFQKKVGIDNINTCAVNANRNNRFKSLFINE